MSLSLFQHKGLRVAGAVIVSLSIIFLLNFGFRAAPTDPIQQANLQSNNLTLTWARQIRNDTLGVRRHSLSSDARILTGTSFKSCS